MVERSLVIVESPAKAKTIKKYLGSDFEVLACYGHVRDLVPKTGAVDPTRHFAMHYEPIERNQKHVAAIIKALKNKKHLYLAPDPDREGEAIAWHLLQLLQEKNALQKQEVRRITFHQITQDAIQQAVAEAHEISMSLVNAQQARRALDYLVGFTLSPLLWKKVRAGLSAGRVQSPALRMIVERDIEIEAFKPQEYWTIEANAQARTQKGSEAFTARLVEFSGAKLEQFTITQEVQAKNAVEQLTKAAKGELLVKKVTRKERKRYPAPPFTTSTLQQEAARKLGFTAQRTMRIAQQLYEGVETEEGPVGLITYMRTDSTHLAEAALEDIRQCIHQKFGAHTVPEKPVFYKTKTKNAQEAHEAIRPTAALRFPEALKARLSIEQHRLYELIWKRTLASQMIPATLNTVAVDLCATDAHIFRANGSVIVEPGFISVYQEGQDEKDSASDNQEKMLPPLEEGEKVKLLDIIPTQHFTEPPPRYTEASLIKSLEEHGIGRPSTYATIIATLQNREYVVMNNKRFFATDVGRVVTRFLTEYFHQYVDYNFTARMEDDLDDIARGEKEWVPVLEAFWQPFKESVEHTDKTVKRSDVTQEKIEEKCPKCGNPLSIRLGKRGRFIGCTHYPECDYTRNLESSTPEAEAAAPTVLDRKCPKCESPLVIKHGAYGQFIGCSGYPKCKFIEPINKPKDSGVTCPKCKGNTLWERKSRRGKIFYSCAGYPKCDYALWNEPLAEPCPKCHWPILTLKRTKRYGEQKICPQAACGFIAAPDPGASAG